MLKVGDQVNQTKVKLHDNSEISFPETGKKYILFFYPKDNTPGCTAEACSLRDGYGDIKKLGYELYGVSVDTIKSHLKFIDNHQLPFPLISDDEKKLVEVFGVWGMKKFMGREYMGTTRATFIIDGSGTITHLIEKVDTKNASQQIIDLLAKN
jgi:peroxiredoxin Q/BCP